MASSGIVIADIVLTTYDKMKVNKKSDKGEIPRKCLILRLSDDKKEVVIDKDDTDGPEEDKYSQLNYKQLYDHFVGRFEKSPRYVVFDYDYIDTSNNKDGTPNKKLVFISWVPDGSKIKDKMVYAATAEHVFKKLDGIGCKVQANDKDAIEEAEILKLVT